MTFTTTAANRYIHDNLSKTKQQYRPQAHFAAPLGWINDPNGLIYFKGKYHLFYQYNPYSAVWDTMHWGHATSTNLVDWENQPVALAPDRPYDRNGVFSGSAIVHDGMLYLMYTGHIINNDGTIIENQNIAFSEDGIHFEKYIDNPVIDTIDLPVGASAKDFRDPKIIKHDNKYYVVIASSMKNIAGQILMYESEDLIHWTYKSVVLTGIPELGQIAECPDLFSLGNRDGLVFSAIGVKNDVHNVFIALGKFDWESGQFEVEEIQPLDISNDFYAPQSFEYKGHRIMIPWLRSAEDTDFLANHKQFWNGQMGSPRILQLDEHNHLIQIPYVPAGAIQHTVIDNTPVQVDTATSFVLTEGFRTGQSLSFTSESGAILVAQTDDQLQLVIDHNGQKRQFVFTSEPQEMVHIILDRSSFEIFVNSKCVASVIYFFEEPIHSVHSTNGTVQVINRIFS